MPPAPVSSPRGRRTPAAPGAACGGASSARGRGRRGARAASEPSATIRSSTSTASWRTTRRFFSSTASIRSAGCRRPARAPRWREVGLGMRLAISAVVSPMPEPISRTSGALRPKILLVGERDAVLRKELSRARLCAGVVLPCRRTKLRIGRFKRPSERIFLRRARRALRSRASSACGRPGRPRGRPRPPSSWRAPSAPGSCAAAMAVFISTPSQPSSMAIAASEAVPTPASTITGTVAFSIISCRFHGLRMPMPEPMSEASGITRRSRSPPASAPGSDRRSSTPSP